MNKSNTSTRKHVKVFGGWPLLLVCIAIVVVLVIVGV